MLTITNLARFTDYATYILLNPGFTWTITTPKVTVRALGTIFEDGKHFLIHSFQSKTH